MSITASPKRTPRYITSAVKIAVMLSVANQAMALPDEIEIDAKLNQYTDRSALCVGRGMSKKLTSEAGFKLRWYEGQNFNWYLGFVKEYCMLNKESLSEGKFSLGIGYIF